MIGTLLRQEAVTLFAQRYPYVLFAALGTLQVLRMLSLALTPPTSSLTLVTAPQLWADGLSWALRLLVFVVLVLGAMSFSRELSLGTAKTVLVLPVRRRDWLVAKLAALTLLAWALLLGGALLGAGIVAATTGWAAVVREGLVLSTPGAYVGDLFLALGLTALYLLPLCAFALLIGLFFSNSGAAVGVAVLLGTVLESVSGLFSGGRYVFVYHLHRPLELLEKLGKGQAFGWHEALTLGVGVTLGWFAVLALLAWLRLERMDVTA